VIELRMARLAPIQSQTSQIGPRHGETGLAFSYLYLFRRIVVGLAVVSALVAFAEQWTGLAAAFLTIGIGEWLESSYYLNVLHWRRRQRGTSASHGRAAVHDLPASARDHWTADSAAGSVGAFGSSHATTSSTSVVTSTPTKTA
jgi:hypothetical protein